jgi:hypothetical protein
MHLVTLFDDDISIFFLRSFNILFLDVNKYMLVQYFFIINDSTLLTVSLRLKGCGHRSVRKDL